jgi:hypothetical protein
MLPAYIRAISRDDLSPYLLHLSWGTGVDAGSLTPPQVLRSIIREWKVRSSLRPDIVNNDVRGAACFYDVPLQQWQRLVETNPTGRRPYGLIVERNVFWQKGGRPAIYTDAPHLGWPDGERFRLIRTELNRPDQPVDWMHEREWRFPGPLTLDGPRLQWWWPCVLTVEEAHSLMREFYPKIYSVYAFEAGCTINRQW